MVSIGVLGTGVQCIGTLEEDGSLSNVYILMLQRPPSGQEGVSCALVSPFQPFSMDASLKRVDKSFLLGTVPAPKELMDVYTTRTSGIIVANPLDVAMVNKTSKYKG